MKPQIKYIGENISYKRLRNLILDRQYNDDHTILLNEKNLDDIILEYRDIYNESMTFPHLLMGVLIKGGIDTYIPFNRVGIIKNDSESRREINKSEFDFYDGEIVYRCGWCGNVVDENGIVLEGYYRNRTINYIENNLDSIVNYKEGSCCPNGADSIRN